MGPIKFFFTVLMLIAVQCSFGQNNFFFTHYMFNPSYYNPAWVGVEDEAFAAAHHRTQWAGYDATFDPGGAPSTQLLSLVIPIKGKLSGFGVSVANDKAGSLNSIQTRFSISAKTQFGFGQFSFGIMPSVNSQSISPNFRARDPDDQLIPTSQETQLRLNLHAGVFFRSRRDYFVGATIENIPEPGFNYGTTANNTIETSYLLMGGTEWRFTRDLTLKPTILLRTDLKAYSFELSMIASYQDKLWGGLAFRRSESLSLLMGYSFLEDNKLKVGYSFDYVIKNKEAKEVTSHEIFLKYDLPNLVFGGRKVVKTPRFTF